MVNDFSEKIRFVIDKEGTIEMDIVGTKGSSCDQIVKLFEPLGQIQQNKPKKEYYEQPLSPTTQIRQQYR